MLWSIDRCQDRVNRWPVSQTVSSRRGYMLFEVFRWQVTSFQLIAGSTPSGCFSGFIYLCFSSFISPNVNRKTSLIIICFVLLSARTSLKFSIHFQDLGVPCIRLFVSANVSRRGSLRDYLIYSKTPIPVIIFASQFKCDVNNSCGTSLLPPSSLMRQMPHHLIYSKMLIPV